MTPPTTYFATTAKGMEHVLAEELRALGGLALDERLAGVSFEAGLETAYRACLWSRVASRVLLPLATIDAADEEALYDGVRSIRWSEHLGPSQTLAVDFSTSHSKITHSHFGALKTKDAIVDQLRDESGTRPSVDTARPDVRVNVYLHEDRATISIDLSGDSLHRRGYRSEGAPAPLKENLAAAVLLIADWPRRADAGVPLLDPMCGSGTLCIEAAMMAAEIAPGLARSYFGFLGWRGHDRSLWQRLVEEARQVQVRDAKKLPPIVGYDVDPRAVRSALAGVEKANLRGIVHVEKRALADCQPIPRRGAPPPELDLDGLLVTNPPYGERLGEAAALGPLYAELGDVLRRRFGGWTGYVLAGNLELAKQIGLRPSRRHVLYNGAIECRLLELPISRTPVSAATADAGPAWRRDPATRAARPHQLGTGAEMFANRLRKDLRHLGKWARRDEVHCWRVYDADLPEYAVAVDLYERAVHVQEYAPPKEIEPERAEARLRDVMAIVPEVLEVEPADVHLKVRRRQRPETQYEKQSSKKSELEVREGGFHFFVNLTDYLDTGLFLDHRNLRKLLKEQAAGKRVLNLFAYTGTATVYAAGGGAVSTTSVDLSRTYLDWARRNLDRNGFRGRAHELIQADCLEWLDAERRRRYDLIFLAPPTFSNSKRMDGTFEVQRDHLALLQSCSELLAPGGVILFSNHFRRFKLDEGALPGLLAENITRHTLPPDFARNPRIHNSWRITRSS